VNTNNFAVDVSGWQISNAVSFVFQGGTVIPAGWSVYLSPDVKTFRARGESPKGGEDIFLQGNYAGHLSSDPGVFEEVVFFLSVLVALLYPGNDE